MVAIIKYNAGNARSVKNALDRLQVESVITDDTKQILSAEKVIFPGVGQAGSAMAYLESKGLDELIKQIKVPFLGICLGMQLMCSYSEEGDTPCLGIFDTQVKRFPDHLRVPHIGWNEVYQTKGDLFRRSLNKEDMYFVHSYYVEPNEDCIAMCDYGLNFAVAINKDNFYGVQFHPEKSADVGSLLIKNFLDL